jgi:hypothetical protein
LLTDSFGIRKKFGSRILRAQVIIIKIILCDYP